MSNILELVVRVLHLEKEFDVAVPETTTAQRLYDALMTKVEPSNSSQDPEDHDIYHLVTMRAQKIIYPDYKDQTLLQIGIQTGDIVIVPIWFDGS